jgi:predicted DNA-binding protein (UPF0278 family)
MYINDYEFGKANFGCVKKVAEHFSNVGANCPSSADDMGVNGSFMSSLVRRGVAKIVGKKEVFVCIDEHEGLYRKYNANLYVLNITASDFWKMYVRSVEQECNHKKRQAEEYVSEAKRKLTEVERLLDRVGTVCI